MPFGGCDLRVPNNPDAGTVASRSGVVKGLRRAPKPVTTCEGMVRDDDPVEPAVQRPARGTRPPCPPHPAASILSRPLSRVGAGASGACPHARRGRPPAPVGGGYCRRCSGSDRAPAPAGRASLAGTAILRSRASSCGTAGRCSVGSGNQPQRASWLWSDRNALLHSG